jgi:hypothetical protein
VGPNTVVNGQGVDPLAPTNCVDSRDCALLAQTDRQFSNDVDITGDGLLDVGCSVQMLRQCPVLCRHPACVGRKLCARLCPVILTFAVPATSLLGCFDINTNASQPCSLLQLTHGCTNTDVQRICRRTCGLCLPVTSDTPLPIGSWCFRVL